MSKPMSVYTLVCSIMMMVFSHHYDAINLHAQPLEKTKAHESNAPEQTNAKPEGVESKLNPASASHVKPLTGDASKPALPTSKNGSTSTSYMGLADGKKKFLCSVTVERIVVAKDRMDGSSWDEGNGVQSAPDLSVHLYGAKKRFIHAWPVIVDQYQVDLNKTTTWSPCLRYQPMMLVVYDQDPDDVLEMIAELPLRVDLLRRMPQFGETKRARVRLSGGLVQLLDITVAITLVGIIEEVTTTPK